MAGKTENSTSDRSAWEEHGRSLLDRESERGWELAEWVYAGIVSHGVTAGWIAGFSGLSKSTCHRFQRTIETFPRSARVEGLSFSHHSAVAKLEPQNAAALLETARAENQSSRTLAKAARRLEDASEVRRLKRENAALRKRLDSANERLAAETVERITASVADSLKATGRGYRQAARSVAELAESGLLDYVHGNARSGAIRAIERLVNAQGRKNESLIGEIESSIGRLKKDG